MTSKADFYKNVQIQCISENLSHIPKQLFPQIISSKIRGYNYCMMHPCYTFLKFWWYIQATIWLIVLSFLFFKLFLLIDCTDYQRSNGEISRPLRNYIVVYISVTDRKITVAASVISVECRIGLTFSQMYYWSYFNGKIYLTKTMINKAESSYCCFKRLQSIYLMN